MPAVPEEGCEESRSKKKLKSWNLQKGGLAYIAFLFALERNLFACFLINLSYEYEITNKAFESSYYLIWRIQANAFDRTA